MEVGFGRSAIDVFEPGMPMLGWGVPENVARSFDAPLAVRAMAVREGGRTLVYALADLCFVSAALRVGVIEALRPRGLDPADVMLTATHTHRGPNGFSHAFFYDLSALGFSPRVHAGLIGAFVAAIEGALDALRPGRLRIGEATIPTREPVAFNRSLGAYLRNPEARREPAVDRRVLALEATDAAGRPIGCLGFFALHATSMHADATGLHPDHKGLAAEELERSRGEGYVALFAQGAAGDVSPNYRPSATRGFAVGRFDADEDSARYVAGVQARATERALETASDVSGPLDARLRRVDFEAGGEPARLGVAMAAGTAEGPGPLAPWSAALSWLRRRPDPKATLLHVGPGRRRRLLGRFDPARLPIPHPAFAHARRADVGGSLARHPWIPTVLPLQIFRLGDALAIVALPNEPTTQAGRRLARRLRPLLGVRAVHVQGYANAYSGYLTTPEEYAAQRYEGAYTLFGPASLARFEAALVELATDPSAGGGPALPVLDGPALEARRFDHGSGAGLSAGSGPTWGSGSGVGSV